MNSNLNDPITDHLERSLAALQRAAGDVGLMAVAREIATAIIAALQSGNKLLIIGNGGSAADAQHIAAEIVGRYKKERPGYAAIALTTDSSALTSIANDFGFEQVFARQVEGVGRRGDVLLALSTSGKSPNILAALVWRARESSSSSALPGSVARKSPRFAIICSSPPATTRRSFSRFISPSRMEFAIRSSAP